MVTQTKEKICTTPTPLELEKSLLYILLYIVFDGSYAEWYIWPHQTLLI
jgi:hypothetical protein